MFPSARVKLAVGGALCAASTAAFSQQQTIELPDVLIEGRRELTYGRAAGSLPPPFDPLTHAFVMRVSQMNMVAARFKDVRCSADMDMANTTSLSDVHTRWMAASSVYTRLMTASDAINGFRSAIIGQVVNPSDGKTYKAFQVVYADGGTEKWMIFPSLAASIKLFDDPYPGSLVQKDGVARKSPYCPNRG